MYLKKETAEPATPSVASPTTQIPGVSDQTRPSETTSYETIPGASDDEHAMSGIEAALPSGPSAETQPLHITFSDNQTINALATSTGTLKKAAVTGQVELSVSTLASICKYISSKQPSEEDARVKVTFSEKLHVEVVHAAAGLEEPNAIIINFKAFTADEKDAVLFRYKYPTTSEQAAETSDLFNPFIVKPIWKCQESQASLLVCIQVSEFFNRRGQNIQ